MTTTSRSQSRLLRALTLALLALPTAAQAQFTADRLEFHGALNAAYGRAEGLPVFGLPVTGTSDYRVFTLQARFKLTDDDQLVAQVFNRRLGTSPFAPALSDLTMQWAYWQHRDGDLTFKIGRNPLPRGLVNEVRYIGVVLPFFRPAIEMTGEAFDAIDGAVVTYKTSLPMDIELEQHVFGGGSEDRSMANTATGQELRIARTENMYGGQTYLRLPIANMRLGAYAARYDFDQPTQRGDRVNIVFSAEASPLDRVKISAEHGRYTGSGPSNDSRDGYQEIVVRLNEKFSVAGQHSYTSRMLFFPDNSLSFRYPETSSKGASVIYRILPNTVVKLENHWRDGWSFDVPTNPVGSQTATEVTLSPIRHAQYFLFSVAAGF